MKFLSMSAPVLLAFAGAGLAQSTATAISDATRSIPPIAAQWAAAWENDDAQGMAALFTPDGIYEDFAFQARFDGQDGVAMWVEITARAIPDARAEIIDAFRAGDRVAIRWTFHGTPENFAAIPGTGRSFAVPAATILNMDGEKIAKASDFYNLADVFRQVGIEAGPWVPPNP